MLIVFSHFKWDHKTDDCILIEYHKNVFNRRNNSWKSWPDKGIVVGLIDEIGIVELINQKLGVDNREKNYYWTSNKSFNFELVRDGLASIIFI